MMNSNGRRVNAIALAEASNLHVQIMTVQAVPLRLS